MRLNGYRYDIEQSSLKPPFYILSPGYSPYAGGPITLHCLCHYLNRIGYEAYLLADVFSGTLTTPALTAGIVRAHAEAKRDPIAIYPEVCAGNPLACRRIIRYILNFPGERGENPNELIDFWNQEDRQNEFFFYFSEEFKLDYLPSASLSVPIVDERIFWPAPEACERDGFLVYSHRVPVEADMIPAWAHPFVMIEMANPRRPSELAELYRKSSGLILMERTGAQHEALMCGCPVVGIPNDHFQELPMFSRFSNVGVGWGSDITQLAWSARTVAIFQRIYHAHIDAFPVELTSRIEQALRFFSARDAIADIPTQ